MKTNQIQRFLKASCARKDRTVQDLSVFVTGSRTSFFNRCKDPGKFRYEEILRIFTFLEMDRTQQDEFYKALKMEVRR